jgi:hypothetical protein
MRGIQAWVQTHLRTATFNPFPAVDETIRLIWQPITLTLDDEPVGKRQPGRNQAITLKLRGILL